MRPAGLRFRPIGGWAANLPEGPRSAGRRWSTPVIASVDNHSAVLENSSVVGTGSHPVAIGQRTVFGHRCQVSGHPRGGRLRAWGPQLLLGLRHPLLGRRRRRRRGAAGGPDARGAPGQRHRPPGHRHRGGPGAATTSWLRRRRRAVVIGGGYIGVEMAEALDLAYAPPFSPVWIPSWSPPARPRQPSAPPPEPHRGLQQASRAPAGRLARMVAAAPGRRSDARASRR